MISACSGAHAPVYSTIMNSFKRRISERQILGGTWCNLGSTVTAEIAGLSGFDWVLIDLEHGSGTLTSLTPQLQAVGCTSAEAIVRIAANEPARYKRVLDMGARGVMVPYVNDADEAAQAVASLRYPPAGFRGVAKSHRATRYGSEFESYFSTSADSLVLATQIETADALENADAIAAVDGVDVLFVGPLDLSTNLGIQAEYDHPKFEAALSRVSDAAANAGKASGILLSEPDDVRRVAKIGYTFLAVGSDIGHVVAGMKKNSALIEEIRSKS